MDTYPKTSGNIKKSILFENKDQKTYCIGCLENDRYIYLPEKEADIIYLILSNMDGQTSLEEINQIIKGDFDKKVNIMEVYNLCLNSGLIKPIDGEKAKPKKDELEALVVNLKSFCLHRLHPFLEKINLILPLILCIVMVIDLASIGLSVFNLNNFPWQLLLSNPIVIIYLLIISLVSLVIHEFSHAIMAYRYGIKPKSFTVGIFAFFSLLFYIKIPGIYLLPPSKRIKVWSAGIFSNVFLVSLFFIIFCFSGGQIQLIATVGVINNVMTIITNILPFYYSDGYYIMSTLLKTPNLRKKSLLQINKLIKNKLDKTTLIYWIYLIITLFVTLTFLSVQIYIIVSSVTSKLGEGYNTFDILRSYLNIIILMSIGIIGKIISLIKK